MCSVSDRRFSSVTVGRPTTSADDCGRGSGGGGSSSGSGGSIGGSGRGGGGGVGGEARGAMAVVCVATRTDLLRRVGGRLAMTVVILRRRR